MILSSTSALATNYTVPYTFSPSTTIQSSQVNANFSAAATVINGQLDHNNLSASANITGTQLSPTAGITASQLSASVSFVPYGTVVAWWATDVTVPTGWALCNGQTTTWQTGPHAGGSITLPNLIGMYIQGADITGGASTANPNGFGSQGNQNQVGTINHNHSVNITSGAPAGGNNNCLSGVGVVVSVPSHVHAVTGTTGTTGNQPSAYMMVYIMKL